MKPSLQSFDRSRLSQAVRATSVTTLSAAFVLCALCIGAPAVLAADVQGTSISGIDPKTRPGDDFYRYVNGGWIDGAEIPADKSSWGVGAILAEATNERVADLIREAAKNSGASADTQRVGAYFNAYMDEAGIEAKGLEPIQADLTAIAAIKDKKALAHFLGSRLRADVDALNSTNFYTENLFGLWVVQGFHDPAHYHPYLLQGGLGLPDRDYYVSTSARMADLRTKYQAYIATVLTMAKLPDAAARAAEVFALELRLAQTHVKREDSEDVHKADNSWSKKDFAAKAAGMDWDAYFAGAGLSGQPDFIVWHPGAVTGAAAEVKATPLAVWQDYLTFHTINHVAGALPKAYSDARFAFFGTALSGTPQQSLRWKRALASTSSAVGFSVGRLYTERYFTADSKARAQKMVANIVTAFGDRIDHLEWMAPATKAQARAKLKTLYVGVGYPDKWKDYSGLTIRADDAVGNAERAELFNYQEAIARLGKPVDRYEWCMVPQVVNAVNMPMQNALNFPAAILQPPFFDASASDAHNYGAIGAVIGHEISHSFDDQGAQFDAEGRLQNWWTADDLAHFERSSRALATQYSAYKPFPDLAVNGQQTLSENIADLAGLLASHDAFRTALGKKSTANGDADDREFFMAYGLSWRQKEREAALRRQIATDGHAPDNYRVSTVRNLDAWYSTFDVQPSQGLYLTPAQRVRVW